MMPNQPSSWPQSIWSYLTRRGESGRTATELYGRVVAQARAPWFYSDLGVPDQPEGRLEIVLLHVTLVLARLKAEGAGAEPLARALAEAFVTDMDDCLREMGVGDQTVAKKVKKAAAALFDRCRDYTAALASATDDDLVRLTAAHLVEAGNGAGAAALAAYARASSRRLAGIDAADLSAGRVEFAVQPSSPGPPVRGSLADN